MHKTSAHAVPSKLRYIYIYIFWLIEQIKVLGNWLPFPKF